MRQVVLKNLKTNEESTLDAEALFVDARSAGVGLAVPISMPRYTCMESAETIIAPASRASRMARSDLPDAVGPTMAMMFRRGFPSGCGRPR